MTTDLTEEDEGKRIVTANGNDLGMIVEVREGTPYVDADPTLFEELETELDLGDPEDDAYPLPTAEVATVTDDEVRLR